MTFSETDFNYFDQAMKIDVFNLSDEVTKQAYQHNKIAREHVFAKSRLAEAKVNVKRVFAERSKYYRSVLPDMSVKVTDASVKIHAEADHIYAEALQRVNDYEQIAGRLEGLRESSAQRAFQFKNLVDLVIDGAHTSETIRPSKRVIPGSNGVSQYDEARAAMAEARKQRNKPQRETL